MLWNSYTYYLTFSEKESAFFTWSKENLDTQLPIAIGSTASFTLYINAIGDFVNPMKLKSGMHFLLYNSKFSCLYIFLGLYWIYSCVCIMSTPWYTWDALTVGITGGFCINDSYSRQETGNCSQIIFINLLKYSYLNKNVLDGRRTNSNLLTK